MFMQQKIWQKLEYNLNFARKELLNMELEKLIDELSVNLEDVKQHLADFCFVEVKNVEAIIEYLKQLKEIKQNI